MWLHIPNTLHVSLTLTTHVAAYSKHIACFTYTYNTCGCIFQTHCMFHLHLQHMWLHIPNTLHVSLTLTTHVAAYSKHIACFTYTYNTCGCIFQTHCMFHFHLQHMWLHIPNTLHVSLTITTHVAAYSKHIACFTYNYNTCGC